MNRADAGSAPASAPQALKHPRGRLLAAAWLAVVCCAAVMLGLTWRTWFDPIVDTGQDFYAAWRITQGEHLGRELAYLHGPLSPYLLAFWLKMTSTSMVWGVVCNLVWMVVLVVCLAVVLSRAAGQAAAIVAAMTFTLVYLVGDYSHYSGYNYLTPYKQPLVHGLVLAWVALACATHFAQQGKRRWLAAGACCAGLAFLTKIECFLGALLPLVAITLLHAWRETWRPLLRHVLTLAGGVAVMPLLAWALLILPLGPRAAGRVVGGEWVYLIGRGAAQTTFYRHLMGLDEPLHRIGVMLVWCLPYALVLAIGAAVGWWMKRRNPRPAVAMLVSAALAAAVVAASYHQVGLVLTLRELPAPLPLLTWIAALVLFIALVRKANAGDQATFAIAAARLGLALLAGCMLLKMGLKPRLSDYGFALTMPAAMLAIAGGLNWLPQAMRRWADPRPLMIAAAVLLAMTALPLAYLTAQRAAGKTFAVGQGGDRFYADHRGHYVEQALRLLAQRTQPDETLVVLPDGVSINYLARRVNPTGYLNFVPQEVALFGEQTMLARFQADPPDHLLIIDVDTSEYGAGLFGQDYAQDLWAWIKREYQPQAVLGEQPLHGRGFGIMWARRVARASPSITLMHRITP